VNVRSAWVAETGQTREDTRLTVLGAMTPVNPVQARSGILPGSYDGVSRVAGFWVSGASAMTATLHEGRALIQGQIGQGAYPVTLPEQVTLTFADGNAQYGRIDLVILHVYDDAYDNSGRNEAAVEILQGIPAATPAPPAVPDLALPLYQVLVRAGASAGTGGIDWTGLTDLRTTTVSVGGILPSYGDGGLIGAYPGQYKDDAVSLQRWSGTAWEQYPRALGGIAPSGTVTNGSYVGQYRDGTGGVLQRWNGSAWQYAEGSATVLFSVSQTSSQTFANNVWTVVKLNGVDVDDTNGWNGTTSAYTVSRSGWWRVSGHVVWYSESANGSRAARLFVNGTGVARATWMVGAGGFVTSVGGECLIRFSAGDSLQMQALQNSGTSVSTLGGSGYYGNLCAEWIRS
jgi:hypothetical protein